MEKILVVDDVPDILHLFSEMLRRKGYQVICAQDGLTAVECALREKPSLILLDISMPNVSGLEVAALLRRMQSRYIPIIAISGTNHSEACREAGIDHFVMKPVGLEELHAVVKRFASPA